VLSGPAIILTLKILVSVVTVLFVAAVVAIGNGNRKLHGRLNTAFFALTMTTVVAFELLLRLGTDVTSTFSPEAIKALRVHLLFAVPSAVLLPVMFVLGKLRWRILHTATGCLFTVLWVGTFVTGVFFLPHDG
jgi:uncharacterized membrane protein YozB (DUF420 family)